MHCSDIPRGSDQHTKSYLYIYILLTVSFSASETLLNSTVDLQNNSQAQEQLQMIQSIQESIADLEVRMTHEYNKHCLLVFSPRDNSVPFVCRMTIQKC